MLQADSVGVALLVVLDTLTPAERLAFVCTTWSACRSARSPPSWIAHRLPHASSPVEHGGAYAERAGLPARPALVDGAVGAVWMHRGRPRAVFAFTIEDDTITVIDLLADPDRLAQLHLQIEPAESVPC